MKVCQYLKAIFTHGGKKGGENAGKVKMFSRENEVACQQ